MCSVTYLVQTGNVILGGHQQHWMAPKSLRLKSQTAPEGLSTYLRWPSVHTCICDWLWPRSSRYLLFDLDASEALQLLAPACGDTMSTTSAKHSTWNSPVDPQILISSCSDSMAAYVEHLIIGWGCSNIVIQQIMMLIDNAMVTGNALMHYALPVTKSRYCFSRKIRLISVSEEIVSYAWAIDMTRVHWLT